MRKAELEEKVRAYRRKVELASSWTDDADALECIELFPKWEAGKDVIVGERLQHNSLLYKCVQAHTTQAEWAPDITPALWTRVSVEEFPEWVQPTGSADAYMTGDKVTYLGEHYVSAIDSNVWAPDVYGWNRI